jgi:hypothetical protein
MIYFVAIFVLGVFVGVGLVSALVRRDLRRMEKERELWQRLHG